MPRKMLSLTILFFLFSLFSAPAFSQEMTDVVYLKNGSIIRAMILELVPNSSVKIETADGSVFVYKMSEVEKIAKEKAPAAKVAVSTVPLSPFAMQLNALGFLQFGPVIKAEIQLAPYFYLTPYARLFALGLASKAVAMGDADTLNIDLTSMGVGLGVMRFFPTRGSPNGLYTGVSLDYDWITVVEDPEMSWAHRRDTRGLVVVSNVGYRWRAKPLNFSIGALLGGFFGLSEEWWYLNSSYAATYKREGSPMSSVYGMLEATIGFELDTAPKAAGAKPAGAKAAGGKPAAKSESIFGGP